MITLAITIQEHPESLAEMQLAWGTESATEVETRVAGCISHALTVSMEELMRLYANGLIISAEGIAKTAREAVRAAQG